METQLIHNRVFEIRGMRVMLDFHLAELYAVETKALNQAAKRNLRRFPHDFMFQLTETEWRTLKDRINIENVDIGMRSQIVTASSRN